MGTVHIHNFCIICEIEDINCYKENGIFCESANMFFAKSISEGIDVSGLKPEK